MKISNYLRAAAVAIALSVGRAPLVRAADDQAAAQAAFDQARSLYSSDINACVAALRGVIDRFPDFADAHLYYILYRNVAVTRSGTEAEKKAASAKNAKETEALYQQWAKEHPDKAAYQYALGYIFDYKDPDRSVRYYETAVKLDPKYGAAWDMLAISAEEKGELARSRELHRKAVDAEPDNVQLWRHLVGAWHDENIDRAVEIGMEMSQRFPDGAASIISYLATRARDENKSREIYELLRAKFPQASAPSLLPLFSIYLKQRDTARAFALAKEMAQLVPENKDWQLVIKFVQNLVDSGALIAQGKAAEAAAALEKVALPRYGVERRFLDLAKARALDAAGQTERSYGDLLAVFLKTPNDDVHDALVSYGKKLGKTVAQVDGEVLTRRAENAKPGVPFSLVNYATGKSVSLDDFKGRVVLVNFWYPKCGPCRGEFPFLQAVLEKYRDRGFEILAINGHAPEDEWVMPLIKGWRLGFIPLKGSEEVVNAYHVRGFPSNFLYGPDGKIYYEPPPVNGLTAVRELELQIEALLAHAKQS